MKQTLSLSAALAALATLAAPARAQDGPPPGWVGPPPGWSGGILAGASVSPRYEGSDESRTLPVLGAEVSYRDLRAGTFSMGSRGLVWTPRQSPAGSVSVGLSLDPGRLDENSDKLTPAGLRPGSDHLRGMGEVKMAPLLSVSGALTVLGPLAVTGALRQAAGSHRGQHAELGLSLPLHLHPHATLTLAPSVTWADRRHMQAYFGVTPEQSVRSGFVVFEAGSGVKSRQLLVDLDLALSRWWYVNATLRSERLLHDAAATPIVQRTRQTSGMLAVRYQFQL